MSRQNNISIKISIISHITSIKNCVYLIVEIWTKWSSTIIYRWSPLTSFLIEQLCTEKIESLHWHPWRSNRNCPPKWLFVLSVKALSSVHFRDTCAVRITTMKKCRIGNCSNNKRSIVIVRVRFAFPWISRLDLLTVSTIMFRWFFCLFNYPRIGLNFSNMFQKLVKLWFLSRSGIGRSPCYQILRMNRI
jgi:hypothetical protein